MPEPTEERVPQQMRPIYEEAFRKGLIPYIPARGRPDLV